jgi:ZIP family zinc transporter
MPVFHATHSRLTALALGTLSGLSEPFGALIASFIANENSSTGAFGAMFGVTAGMMT